MLQTTVDNNVIIYFKEYRFQIKGFIFMSVQLILIADDPHLVPFIRCIIIANS